MFTSFIFALAAVWFAPKAEPHVKDVVEKMLPLDTAATAIELRLVSFALCLLAAAILAAIIDDSHGVALAIGAFSGVLAPRLQSAYRASRNPDYDS